MKIQQPPQALPGTFVDDPDGFPTLDTATGFDLFAHGAASTWHTLEVADWPGLADVPLSADWIEVRFEPFAQAVTTGRMVLTAYARLPGSSVPFATGSRVAHLEVIGDNTVRHLNVNVAKIPLNPGAGVVQAELNWTGSNYNAGQTTLNCFIIGYGTNP